MTDFKMYKQISFLIFKDRSLWELTKLKVYRLVKGSVTK